MATINAVLHAKGLTINGITIAEAPPFEVIKNAVGDSVYRDLDRVNQGKPWRKFVVCDSLGVRFLYDYEIERVLDIEFSFLAEKSRSSPESVFQGVLVVNGVRLISDMAERLLPIKGELEFTKNGGWKAKSETLFINIRVSQKRLQAVSVSFLKRPPFASEKA